MSKYIVAPNLAEKWLINLIELKNAHPDLSISHIAEREKISEKSIANVFYGKSKNPGVDLVRKIIHALDGKWADIFEETGAVIGGQDIVALQSELERLQLENSTLMADKEALIAENAVLTEKVNTYRDKLDALKDELLDVHRHYINSGK